MTQFRTLSAYLLIACAVGLVGFALRDLWPGTTATDRVSRPQSSSPIPDANAAYPARNWEQYQSRSLNLSVYPFADRNRNGYYDEGDKPLAGIATVMITPQGTETLERSNTNGYTNFSMRLGPGESSSISQADASYTFRLLSPPGWHVSTGNAVQHVRFKELKGSPAGLVPLRGPEVVGLVPELAVSGTLPSEAGAGPFILRGPSGELSLNTDAEGRYRKVLQAGRWQLLTKIAGDERVFHDFELDALPVVLSTPRIGQKQPQALQRRVVQHFDQHTRARIEKLPNGDAGLAWDYLIATDNQVYGAPGFANGLMSGHNVGYNSSGHPVTISSTRPGEYFDFVGGYFSVAWPDAEGETLEVTAWRGTERVASDQLTLSYLGPQWFEANYRGIDRLELRTSHYWQFAVDDMVFRLPNKKSEAAPVTSRKRSFERLSQAAVPDTPDVSSDLLCGPVVAANALVAAGFGAEQALTELAQSLAKPSFMGTSQARGTASTGFINGLKHYARQQGLVIESLAYQGKEVFPPGTSMGQRVRADWLKGALEQGMSVALNLGWYGPATGQADSYQRVGGHWVELIATRERTLQGHDPLITENTGRFEARFGADYLLPVSDSGHKQLFRIGGTGWPLLENYPLPEGATLAVLEGAIAWRLRLQETESD